MRAPNFFSGKVSAYMKPVCILTSYSVSVVGLNILYLTPAPKQKKENLSFQFNSPVNPVFQKYLRFRRNNCGKFLHQASRDHSSLDASLWLRLTDS